LDRDYYDTGSFYLRVRDGWVHVPEGAFPEFIGFVMGFTTWRRDPVKPNPNPGAPDPLPAYA
jgi:hypothetical protein